MHHRRRRVPAAHLAPRTVTVNLLSHHEQLSRDTCVRGRKINAGTHHGTSCDHNPCPPRDTPGEPRLVATLCVRVRDDHPLLQGRATVITRWRGCPPSRYHLVIILDCAERSLRRPVSQIDYILSRCELIRVPAVISFETLGELCVCFVRVV